MASRSIGAIGGVLLLFMSACVGVGVGYDGGGYEGGIYEPYGYDYGGWAGGYHVGPPRGGPDGRWRNGAGVGRGAPSIPGGARGGVHGGGGHR